MAEADDERVERIWRRIEPQLDLARPSWLAPAITPISPWLLLGAVVLFLPAALVLSFFVRRHVIALTGSELVVYDVTFWRMRVEDEVDRRPLGGAGIALDGARLTLGGRAYHLEPGWADAGRELVELDRAARG